MSIKSNPADGDTHVEEDPDDIEAYIATFDAQEHRDLAAAEAEIDKAVQRYRARQLRVPSRITAHFGTVTPHNRPENWRAVREEAERLMAIDLAAEDASEEHEPR